MVKSTDRSAGSPVVVLLRAFLSNSPLLPIDPTWFRDPNSLKPYGLLCLELGFWVPIKGTRLVPKELTARVVAHFGRLKAFTNMMMFLLGTWGIHELVTSFSRYSSAERMSFRMLFVGLLLCMLPVVFLLLKDGRTLRWKDWPAGDLSESVSTAKWKINTVFFVFKLLISVASAVFALWKVSAPQSVGSGGNLDALSLAGETAAEEGPAIVFNAATMPSLGPSLVLTLGFGLLRTVFGIGFSVGLVYVVQEMIASRSNQEAVALTLLVIAAIGLFAWAFYIRRKYAMPSAW